MLLHMTHRISRSRRQVDPKANSYLNLGRVPKMPTSLSSCSEGVRAASVMPLGQVLGIGPLRRSLAALSACCPPLPTRLANERSRVFWDPRVVRPRGVAGCKVVCSTGAPRAKLSDGRVFVRGRLQRGAIDSSSHVTPFEPSKSLAIEFRGYLYIWTKSLKSILRFAKHNAFKNSLIPKQKKLHGYKIVAVGPIIF